MFSVVYGSATVVVGPKLAANVAVAVAAVTEVRPIVICTSIERALRPASVPKSLRKLRLLMSATGSREHGDQVRGVVHLLVGGGARPERDRVPDAAVDVLESVWRDVAGDLSAERAHGSEHADRGEERVVHG
jgi:FAD/FMN-containing dehydrogenase